MISEAIPAKERDTQSTHAVMDEALAMALQAEDEEEEEDAQKGAQEGARRSGRAISQNTKK
jgi:hypothetical protein